MWVIQHYVPYEGLHEVNCSSTPEVVAYLNANSLDWDEIYIRPSSKAFNAFEFISEFGES